MTTGILKRCLDEASKSTYKFRVGAVIFKGTRIISSAHNYIRSVSAIPDKYRKWNNSLHAELACVLKVKDWRKLKGCSILVIKSSKNGSLSNSCPCAFCKKTLDYVGINKIYYSNENGEIVLL